MTKTTITESEEALILKHYLFRTPKQVMTIINDRRQPADHIDKHTIVIILIQLRNNYFKEHKTYRLRKEKRAGKPRLPILKPVKETSFISRLRKPKDTGGFVDHREFDVYYK